MAWLKLTEIKSLIKSGDFNKGDDGFGLRQLLKRGGQGSFCNGNILWKFNTNAKIHIKVRLMSKIWIEPERERERETDRQTERDRQTEI